MKRLPYYLLLSFALVFAACDSSSDDDDNGGNSATGESSVIFGGDLGGTFDGNAFFSVQENPEFPSERAFVLFMTEADLTTQGQNQALEYIAFVRFGDRPNRGTYELANFENESDPTVGTVYAIYINSDGSAGSFYGSQSGSLTISESSEGQVNGTFEFTGIGGDFTSEEPSTATFSGSFEAVDVAALSFPSGL